jgi:hypothetical protein
MAPTRDEVDMWDSLRPLTYITRPDHKSLLIQDIEIFDVGTAN